MSFSKYDENGKRIRNRVRLDCSGDEVRVEQSHVKECDINEIVRRHGKDLVQQSVSLMQSQAFRFDDVTGNDFQEAMEKVTKAQESFDSLPSKVRREFDNNPAKFMDFVQNPDNSQKLVEMGLAQRLPENQPVEVIIAQTEPPATETPH